MVKYTGTILSTIFAIILFSQLYATSVELYTSFSPISTPLCSFLSTVHVEQWNYEAILRFGVSLVQQNGLVILKPDVQKPEDVIDSIWFQSERLKLSYGKTQNLRVYDENTYFLQEKSFSLQLMDIIEFVSCSNRQTLMIISPSGVFNAFVSITRGEDTSSSEMGFLLNSAGVIIKNSGLYLGYVGEGVRFEFGPVVSDSVLEAESVLIINSGKMSWGFRSGQDQALIVEMDAGDLGVKVSVHGSEGKMEFFRKIGGVLLTLGVYSFERYSISVAFQIR